MSDLANSGFMIGGRPEDLFKGAAAYYSVYRPSYPPEIIESIVRDCHLDGSGKLLDAGCGTGQVFLALSRYFAETLAIDPDEDMLTHARINAARHELNNVEFKCLRAEDLDSSHGSLRMAVFGNSFHWTDRCLAAEKLYDLLAPNGSLVLLCSGSFLTGSSNWEIIVQNTIERHLGAKRRAGNGFYQEAERHEEILKRTRFNRITITNIMSQEEYTTDEIVGYLYSTSYASREVLGGRAKTFETDLRNALRNLNQAPPFLRSVEQTIIIARR
jgi:SAM-dependent methyltransferase